MYLYVSIVCASVDVRHKSVYWHSVGGSIKHTNSYINHISTPLQKIILFNFFLARER